MLYSVKGIRFDRVKVVRTADTVTEVIGAPSPGMYTIMAPVMGANPLNPLVQVTVMDLSPTSVTMKLVTGAGGTVRVEGQEEGEEKVRGEKGEEGGERVRGGGRKGSREGGWFSINYKNMSGYYSK